MSDPPDHPDDPGDLRTPFIFVPHGDPEPVDWMAAHPGWVKFPATMVPRAAAATARPAAEGPRAEDGQAGDRWARTGRKDPPTPVAPDPYAPMNPAFDPVLTLRRLGHLPEQDAGAVQAQWWMPLLESPLSRQPEEILPRFMERIPRQSGKEAADDTPSWAKGSPRRIGETPDAYARRVMDDRWGKGKWEGIPKRESEFNQIKKLVPGRFGTRDWI